MTWLSAYMGAGTTATRDIGVLRRSGYSNMESVLHRGGDSEEPNRLGGSLDLALVWEEG